MTTVAILDYGMGNLHSIAKALEHVSRGERILVTADPQQVLAADRVVFPGVGAIDECMAALRARGLDAAICETARSRPLLGICLGLQALFDASDEGTTPIPCLSLIPGRVVRFAEPLQDARGQRLKVPHMGWNQVHQTVEHPLWVGIPQDGRFYFVHSYHARPDDARVVAATAEYPEPFVCAVAEGNLFAVQFHPEKSQDVGLRLLANFLDWTP